MNNNQNAVRRIALAFTIAAVLGLAVGFAVRGYRVAAARGAEGGGSKAAFNSSRAESQTPLANPADGPSDLVTGLSKSLSLSSGVTRWLYWTEAIEQAEAADFPRLAQLANGDARAIRLLGDRWIKFAPRQLFDTIIGSSASKLNNPASDLMSQLLDKWPSDDPEAAIAAVQEAGDVPILRDWRWRIAGKIIETDAELGIRLFADWHIDSFIPRMNGIEKWAEANPRHAAEFTLAHPAGYPTGVFVEAIGKVWARTDPRGALDFATSGTASLHEQLARSALKSWAESDLEEAGTWLGAADPATRDSLSVAYVESWAKSDPATALVWCEQNLKGVALIDSARAVLTGAAEKNLKDAANLVSAMQPSTARAHAAAAVAEKWLPASHSERRAAEPEAVRWLASLDSQSRSRVLAGAQWGWSSSDPKGLADFLVSVNDSGIPFSAFHAAATTMARQNPVEAIEWAEKLPATTRGEAGNQVFQEWRRSQPDAAMAWFRELPATDSRRDTYFSNMMGELIRDPQGPAILAKLNETERAAAQRVIEAFQIPPDRKRPLLDALRHAPGEL